MAGYCVKEVEFSYFDGLVVEAEEGDAEEGGAVEEVLDVVLALFEELCYFADVCVDGFGDLFDGV